MSGHGSVTQYRKYGCRCDACKAASRDAARFYRGSKLTIPVATTNGARERAVRRLIDSHPDEFRRLVEDEADVNEEEP